MQKGPSSIVGIKLLLRPRSGHGALRSRLDRAHRGRSLPRQLLAGSVRGAARGVRMPSAHAPGLAHFGLLWGQIACDQSLSIQNAITVEIITLYTNLFLSRIFLFKLNSDRKRLPSAYAKIQFHRPVLKHRCLFTQTKQRIFSSPHFLKKFHLNL